MGRTRNGREPTPEEKENEAIDKFLDETWGPTMDRLSKSFINPEANLKKAQARSNKGDKGKDGTNGTDGERGARGDRGAQGERASAEFNPDGANAGAGTKSFSAKIVNVNATALQASATGFSLSITGYKFGLMAKLFSGTLLDNVLSGLWAGRNAISDRTCGAITQAFAMRKETSELKTRLSALQNEVAALSANN